MNVALVIALAMVLLLFIQFVNNADDTIFPKSKYGDGDDDGDDIIIRIESFICRPKYGDPGKKGANPPTIGAK